MESIEETTIKLVLSKEISHEPTKEIGRRYSNWLEEHKSNLSKEDYDGYSHQYELIQELNQVYDTDSGNITRIVELLLEMHECGQPPSDIVEDLAPDLLVSNLWQFIMKLLLRAAHGTVDISSLSSRVYHDGFPSEERISIVKTLRMALSKEISYELMKEIDTRYSKWLDEHKSSLSKEGYHGYSHQYELIKEHNQVYDTDSGNITRIVELLLEMHECGQPPSDIVQQLAPNLVGSNLGKFIMELLLRAARGIVDMSSQSSEGDHVHLPTGIWCEILLRLPSFNMVCQFRCVSKSWNSLLSEASFIDKISPILLSKLPWILMYDPSDTQAQVCRKQDIQKFVNRHDHRLSFDFLLDTYPFNGQQLEKVCILDSCSNGLVLYSPYALVNERAMAEVDRDINTYLCICNPLTKQWVALPPRPDNGAEQVSNFCTKLVCEPEISCQYASCNYKVVHAYVDILGDNVCFQVFSSDTGEWRMLSSPVNLWRHIEFWRFSDMVIRHGVLYWTGQARGPDGLREVLVGYSLLDNNEEPEHRYKSMDFPIKTDYVNEDSDRGVLSFFGESQGSILYYGQIEDSVVDYKAYLTVYRMDQDDPTNGGLFNCVTVHSNIELKGYTASKIEAIYMDPVNPNVIIIVQWACGLAYNISTLTHEVLYGDLIHKISEFRMRLPPILIRPKSTVIPPLLN